MHVLMTSDTVGGVWTYTQELVRGLIESGHRVTLVSLGAQPRPEQTGWMSGLRALDYVPTSYRLEWMQDSEQEIEESKTYLESLAREVRPDVLHFNQYCYGNLSVDIPRVVVAHSDVVSWWVSVHGREPEEDSWIRWYRETVTNGVNAADTVVAPSQWMLDCVRTYYTRPSYGMVVYNGRDPGQFDPNRKKDQFVLSVGRLWDAAKQVSLLFELNQGMPVCIVGSTDEPGKRPNGTKLSPKANFEFRGSQSQAQLRELYASASTYAATSRYEPFGLAPLEAAFSRCALIANDITSFREIWGDAACYFRANNASDCARLIRQLRRDTVLQEKMAAQAFERACEKFTADKMTKCYEALYENVMAAVARAA